MQFTIEHQIGASLGDVEAALLRTDYYDYLLRESGLLLDVKVELSEDDGQRVHRRVRYTPKPAFDQIGPKEIPAAWFTFVEHSTFDRATHALRFENTPATPKVQRHFRNRGQIQLEQLAPNLTVRRCQAELALHTLKLYLRPLRGLAESMLAREARKLLDAEARLLNQWLAAGPARAAPLASPAASVT